MSSYTRGLNKQVSTFQHHYSDQFFTLYKHTKFRFLQIFQEHLPYFTDRKAQFKSFFFLINWSCAL